MSKIQHLVELGDEFDRIGQHDLADRVDGILRLAANVNVNFDDNAKDRPYSKEEEQRLLVVVFEHVVDLYYESVPKIEYMISFWPALRSALEAARVIIKENMKEKTKAFNFKAYKQWAADLEDYKAKLEKWRQEPLGNTRVIQERYLLVTPMNRLVTKLQTLFSDDPALEAVLKQWQHILSVLDNIFGQTAEQISGVEFKRNL